MKEKKKQEKKKIKERRKGMVKVNKDIWSNS